MPESPYGTTKMVAEHSLKYYALDRSLRYTALRYGNAYGPRQDAFGEGGVVAIFARQLLSGETPTIHWDGEQVRDYVHVADVARANLLAASAGDDRFMCIGTGVGSSVNQIYQAVCDAVGVKVEPHRAPRRPGDLRAAYFTIDRARRDLGWEPTVRFERGWRKPSPLSAASILLTETRRFSDARGQVCVVVSPGTTGWMRTARSGSS